MAAQDIGVRPPSPIHGAGARVTAWKLSRASRRILLSTGGDRTPDLLACAHGRAGGLTSTSGGTPEDDAAPPSMRPSVRTLSDGGCRDRCAGDRDARRAVSLGPIDDYGQSCRDCLPIDRRNTLPESSTAPPSTRPHTVVASSSHRAICTASHPDSDSPRSTHSPGRVGALRDTHDPVAAHQFESRWKPAHWPQRRGREPMPR